MITCETHKYFGQNHNWGLCKTNIFNNAHFSVHIFFLFLYNFSVGFIALKKKFYDEFILSTG